MKFKEPKIFTLQEARGTLPFVSDIVRDLMKLHKDIQDSRKLMENTSENSQKNFLLQHHELLERYQECQQELLSVGCQLHHPEQGIVGYYWDRGDGLIVELYWQFDQPDIEYWHEIGNDTLYHI